MIRRSFLRLAGAAVLGVLTAKVPVFAEEPPWDKLVGMDWGSSYDKAPRGIVYLVDNKGRVLQGIDRTIYTASMEDRIITVPFELPANFDSTWRLTDVRD